MTLLELKNHIDEICRIQEKQCRKPDEIEAVITLEEPVIGARASTGISMVFVGFDWEAGQLRIEPEEPLVRKVKKERGHV